MSQPTTPLREMCELVVDCPHFTPDWTTSGFIVIRNQNIRDGRLNLSDPSYTHKQDFERRNRRAKPRGGDIIFTREAPMGEVCIVPDGLECCIGQRQVLLRPKKEVDNRYFFYALRSNYVRHQIFWNEGTGSTVSNVRIPFLEALKIPRLGPAEESIGSLLGSLDDKIELNRRMNETLEAMARAIFKDWFVDFGPTRAKMEGRAAYLAPEIWSLFPDRLDNEGKPQGWQLRPVGDLAAIRGGKQLEKERIADHGPVPVFGGAGLMGYTDCHNAEGYVISIGRVGAYCGQFFAHRGKAWINNNASLISQNTDIPGEWLFLSLKESDIDMIKKGAAQPFVSNLDLGAVKVIFPNTRVLNAFSDVIINYIIRSEHNDHESATLTHTRDLLLPKLMSGEIRVTDAERIAEAAK